MNSNFTTIEQSNRLLKSGLPKNSADLYYNKFGALEVIPEYRNFNEFCDTTDTPCWSVGRLMEIVDMCSVKQNYAGKFEFEMNKSYIQNLIYLIIGMLHTKDLDFSKLEGI